MVPSSLGHSLVGCPLKQKVVSHLIPFMLAGGHMVLGHRYIYVQSSALHFPVWPLKLRVFHCLLYTMGLKYLLVRIIVKIHDNQMGESTWQMAWHKVGGG